MSQMRAGLVGIVAGTEQVILQMTAEGGWLHCKLSLVVQCIVIGPVCLCVCGFVGLLPR